MLRQTNLRNVVGLFAAIGALTGTDPSLHPHQPCPNACGCWSFVELWFRKETIGLVLIVMLQTSGQLKAHYIYDLATPLSTHVFAFFAASVDVHYKLHW
jgi:hypothetical protein